MLDPDSDFRHLDARGRKSNHRDSATDPHPAYGKQRESGTRGGRHSRARGET